jgi:hypothetical protein
MHDSSSRSSNGVEQADYRRPTWRTSRVFRVDGLCSQERGLSAHQSQGPDKSRQARLTICQRCQQKAGTIAAHQINSFRAGERIEKNLPAEPAGTADRMQPAPVSMDSNRRPHRAISCAVEDDLVTTFRAPERAVCMAESLKSLESLDGKENASRMAAQTARPMRQVHATSARTYTFRCHQDACSTC